MEHWAGILILVLLIAAIVGMFTLVFTLSARERKREKRIQEGYRQLARNAAELGWSYEARTRGRIDHYCGVRPFPGSGLNMSACHYTTGEFRGRSFKYFEYRYMSLTSATDDGPRKPLITSVFIVSAPDSGPFMQILRPNLMDKLFDRRPRMLIGKPAFDKNFRVYADDEDFARNAFSRDLVPYLLTDPQTDKTSLQLHNGELFTWYSGPLTPQTADEKLNYLCDVLDRIPAHAWKDV